MAGICTVVVVFGGFNFPSNNLSIEQRRLEGNSCVEPSDPKALAVLYSLGVLYMFIGLAIIADDFFVPALDVVGDKMGLSPDVAGATLMAAGGSAPELFTSAVGTFLRSDVGFGAIVGSAVFNVLFVVGICSILTPKPMQLTWWPVIRDSSYYIVVLIVLAIFFGVISPQIIEWWEALILHLMYWLYVFIMANNKYLKGIFKVKGGGADDDDEEAVLSDVKNVMFTEASLTSPLDDENPVYFHSATKFRAGILEILLSNKSIFETAGINMVLKVNGSVKEKFDRFDADGNGVIDASELKYLLESLGCAHINDTSVKMVLDEVDKDGNGEIDLTEFNMWYLASEMRIRAETEMCFNKIDRNGDGFIQIAEMIHLLIDLGHDPITEEEAQTIVHEMQNEKREKGDCISLEDFSAWYEKSMFYSNQQHKHIIEQEAPEGLSLFPPAEGGAWVWFWYIITLPLVAAFMVTLVDVRQPGKAKYAAFSFFMCLVWMGIFSYFMVSWVEVVGATAGIPSVIMGLTFLAAGTSVPDMLSAVIVAKQGEGDKAVSSSIGSNVFDVCIGLALPWLLFYAVYQEPVYVSADTLFISILTIAACLFIMVVCFKLRNWLLPPTTGYFFIFLYFCFVAEQLALATWGQC